LPGQVDGKYRDFRLRFIFTVKGVPRWESSLLQRKEKRRVSEEMGAYQSLYTQGFFHLNRGDTLS
jgi:hypothetical protein